MSAARFGVERAFEKPSSSPLASLAVTTRALAIVRDGSSKHAFDILAMFKFDFGRVEDPFGYVYRVVSSSSIYVGQHRFVRGEGWDTYFGSGSRVRRCNRDGLEKHLASIAFSQAQLDLDEMIEIARVRSSGSKCSNILDGGKHRFSRTIVEFEVFFERVSDERFVELASSSHREACLQSLRTVEASYNPCVSRSS